MCRFAAIKVTALGNPVLLERWSTVLSEIRSSFQEFDQDGDGFITFDEFKTASRLLFRSEMTSENQLQAQVGDQRTQSHPPLLACIYLLINLTVRLVGSVCCPLGVLRFK